MTSECTVFSYWTGPVSWMERLTIDSLRYFGHPVTVFTHDPQRLRESGINCDVVDAREVMLDDPALAWLRSTAPSHYSDHFRVEGLRKGAGTWVDLDMVFLKPLPRGAYLFGWENNHSICGAILRMPQHSAALDEYVDICRARPLLRTPRWLPLRARVKRQLKCVRRAITGRTPPPFQFGPPAVTHLVKKYGLGPMVQPATVFYPIPPNKQLVRRMAEDDFIENAITEKTVCVHLWHSIFTRVHGHTEIPPGAWLRRATSIMGSASTLKVVRAI